MNNNLQVSQIECKNCGAKADIHTGLRMKTFTCEYCGSICDNEQVIAMQDQQELKEKFVPRSFLKLGLKAEFLGREYQIVGRIRIKSADFDSPWTWDEWFLMSPTGFPLWIQEDEDGYTLLRKYISDTYIDFDSQFDFEATGKIKIDKSVYKLDEIGNAEIVFLEGEFTWRAKPGEKSEYIDFKAQDKVFTIERSGKELSYYKGKKLTKKELKKAFGDAVPDSFYKEKKKKTKNGKNKKRKFPTLGHWGLLFLIIGIVSMVVALKKSESGKVVYNRRLFIPLNGTAETEIFSTPELKITNTSLKNTRKLQNKTAGNIRKSPVDKRIPLTTHNSFRIEEDSIVKIRIKSGYFPYGRSRSQAGWWCVFSLYRQSEKGEILTGTVNADFWREQGRDSDGYWSESKRKDNTFLKLSRGTYRIEGSAGPYIGNGYKYNKIVKADILIISGVWYKDPLVLFGILAIVFSLILWVAGIVKNKD